MYVSVDQTKGGVEDRGRNGGVVDKDVSGIDMYRGGLRHSPGPGTQEVLSESRARTVSTGGCHRNGSLGPTCGTHSQEDSESERAYDEEIRLPFSVPYYRYSWLRSITTLEVEVVAPFKRGIGTLFHVGAPSFGSVRGIFFFSLSFRWTVSRTTRPHVGRGLSPVWRNSGLGCRSREGERTEERHPRSEKSRRRTRPL